MRTLTLKIPNNRYRQFLDVVKSFGLPSKNIIIEDIGPTKAQILEGIKEAVEEVNQIKAGKKKSVPLKDFLNEF